MDRLMITMRCLTTTCLMLAAGHALAMEGAGTQPVTAQSSQMYNMMMSRFKQADIDKSNTLSRKEAEKMPMLAQHFDEIDRSHDGQISLEELQAEYFQRMQQQHATR